MNDSLNEGVPEGYDVEVPEQQPSEPNGSALRIEETSFSGPIPPPGILDKYNQILPGAADRILSMAEKEQGHRQKMQEKLVDAQVTDINQERSERKLGQIFGFSIGVISIISGSVTAILGSPWAGGFIGSAGVAGLVSVFVLGRRDRRSSQYPQLEEDMDEDE